MIELKLSTAADWMNAKLLGEDCVFEDCVFQGVSTDTRAVQKGNLFVAIKGEKVDAHHFLAEAKANGAVAAIVEDYQADVALPQLQVENSIMALGQLSKKYRQGFSLPLAAVTGSCGKTTVKEMLASILSLGGPILASQGNLNTEVGLPLTLLRLSSQQLCGVVEMGARKKGDIRYLMSLAQPDVTLITNAGVAHLEIFGSERGIAEAKGEIFSSLKPTGTAVINIDDENAGYWRNLLTTQRIVSFALQAKNRAATSPIDFYAENTLETPDATEFDLHTPIGTRKIHLKAFGKHSVSNALAAAAVAYALGISLGDIVAGLEKFLPVTGRLQIKQGKEGLKIIDDTYNANPVSVKAALAVLANSKEKKIFVMGDMLELGANAAELHKQMGEAALALGIDTMYGIGNLTKEAIKAFGAKAKHYADKASLIQALQTEELLNEGNKTILVKGSRGMRMEEIVQALLSPEAVSL